jgi:uncharacterized protein YcnI
MTLALWRNRLLLSLGLVAGVSLLATCAAFAHARVLPAQALSDGTPLTLSVPNEKENAKTTKVVMTVPEGFNIGLFADSPDWKRELQTTGSGEDTRIQKVTWTSTGDGTDTGGLFEFTGRSDPGSYTFQVEQTYSDGSVVDWAGPEDADEPAPIVDMKESFASGGTSTLAIVALVVGAIALVLGAVAVVRGGGRELA